MSAAIVAASCCCDNQVPANNCPGVVDNPSTVRVHITANPKACSAWQNITCVPLPCDPPNFGFIVPAGPCNFSCAPQFPLYGPQISWTSNLATATATYAWSTYTQEPFNPCPGGVPTYDAVVQCGYKSEDYVPWDADFKFALICGPDNNADVCLGCVSTPVVEYYPSQVSFETGDGGIKLTTIGCCCMECACVENPKCSRILMTVEAIWRKTLSLPLIDVSAPAYCDTPGYWIRQTGDAKREVVFQHAQAITLAFERTIYTSQTTATLAPGSYDVACITFAENQCAAISLLGGAWFNPDQPCSIGGGGGFIEANADCAVPCYVETDRCSSAALATHGWGITVSVAAA